MKSIQSFISRKCRKRFVSHSSNRFSMWCERCAAEVETVSLKEAADILRTNTEEIIIRASQGKIHLGICPDAVLFCVNSLLKTENFYPSGH